VNAQGQTSGDRAAFGLLLLHIFLVTALGRYYAKVGIELGPITAYPTELTAVAILLFSSGSLLAVPRDAITNRAFAFVAVGALWVGMSGLGATGAGTKAFSFFAYACFYFATRGLARTDEDRWRVLQAVVYGTLGALFLGLWQVRTGTRVFESADVIQTSTGSTRYLPGEFALYGMLGLIIVGVRPFLRGGATARDLLWLLPSGVILVLAQHRSGFVAFVVALAMTGVFLVGSARVLAGLLKLSLAASVVLGVVVYFFGTEYLNETITRLQHVGDADDVNAAWRLLNWSEVLDGIQDRPLGHGFASWEFLFTQPDPLTGSHNSFLDLAYRVGVVGLLLLLSMPVHMTRQTRAWIRSNSLQSATLLVTVTACTFALLVYASFNMVFESPYMSVQFWILLGIASGAWTERRI